MSKIEAYMTTLWFSDKLGSTMEKEQSQLFQILDELKDIFTVNNYTLLHDLENVDRVGVYFNTEDEAFNAREQQLYHYSSIVTLFEGSNNFKKRTKGKRSDVYVVLENDTFSVYNSELNSFASEVTLDKMCEVVYSLVRNKQTRSIISVVPDERPKNIDQCLSDKRKRHLLTNVAKRAEVTSVSIGINNRPTNLLSRMIAYTNNTPLNDYPLMVSYFDNLNGIIRYSVGTTTRQTARVHLDIIAHQAINEAMSLCFPSLVVFNRYDFDNDTYKVASESSVVSIEPYAINSVSYYKELVKQTIHNYVEDPRVVNLMINNRGVFTIIPLTFTDEQIVNILENNFIEINTR